MSRLILTGADDEQEELLAMTAPVMLVYAIRYGLNFKCVRNYPMDTHPMWQKVALIRDELLFNDQVIWIDADMLITNPEMVPWMVMTKGIHAGMDWGPDATESKHFTTACMVAMKDALPIFDAAVTLREKWHEAEFHEQAYLRSVFDEEVFHIHPRRILGSVPIEVHEDVPDPWQPGDWICHATNLPIQDRIRILRDKL